MLTVVVAGTDLMGPALTPLLAGLKAALLGGGALAVGIGVSVWALKKCWELFGGLVGETVVRDMTWNIPDDSRAHAGGEFGADRGAYREEERSESSYGADRQRADRATDHAAASSYLDRYRGGAS